MSAPVKHTCPDIDKAIEKLAEAIRAINSLDIDKQDKRWIEMDIDAAVDILEDLRTSNDALRSWGTDLDDQLANSADQIYELEQEIEQLKTVQA